MKYCNIVPATFLSRPNRFVAKVIFNGREESVHVKNTGRCQEILVPGCRVYLADSQNEKRKLRYDLVAVEKSSPDRPNLLINMDSQAPNAVVEEWLRGGGHNLFSPGALIKREVTFGSSRFDFFVMDQIRTLYLEVKGVTLEREGLALFPDAPTQRGVKHIEELICAKEMGHDAAILFVIQMQEIHAFSPNDQTHPAFGAALRKAAEHGVQILAMDCRVTKDSLSISSPVPVLL